MNWTRCAILVFGVLTAEAAEQSILPRAGSMNKIAAAREALRQSTDEMGDNHPVTAVKLCNLASSMQAAGYPNYAEHYARQSLAILELHFGPRDPSLVLPLNVLAEAAFSQARFADAGRLAMRAVAIGPDADAHYGTALHNLAAVYQVEGNFDAARDFYQRALAVREKFFPPGHAYVRLTQRALEQLRRQANKASPPAGRSAQEAHRAPAVGAAIRPLDP